MPKRLPRVAKELPGGEPDWNVLRRVAHRLRPDLHRGRGGYAWQDVGPEPWSEDETPDIPFDGDLAF